MRSAERYPFLKTPGCPSIWKMVRCAPHTPRTRRHRASRVAATAAQPLPSQSVWSRVKLLFSSGALTTTARMLRGLEAVRAGMAGLCGAGFAAPRERCSVNACPISSLSGQKRELAKQAVAQGKVALDAGTSVPAVQQGNLELYSDVCASVCRF